MCEWDTIQISNESTSLKLYPACFRWLNSENDADSFNALNYCIIAALSNLLELKVACSSEIFVVTLSCSIFLYFGIIQQSC